MKFFKQTLFVVLLLDLSKVNAQTLVNCIANTNTPCVSGSQIGNGNQGDPAWKAFGKINDNFSNPTWLFNHGNFNTVTLPSISTPSLPITGGLFYVDSNGALHYASQWYDSTLPGAKYIGAADRSWWSTPQGFGLTVTGSGNSLPNVRIQRGNNSAVINAALSETDNVGTLVNGTTTSVILNTVSKSTQPANNLLVAAQIEADVGPTFYGHPFALNAVAKDTRGFKSSTAGASVAFEGDVDASGPDDLTIGVRVISDNICREIVTSSDGFTQCTHGVRSRPSDVAATGTGPAELIYAFEAATDQSYPGGYILNGFYSDGGATNGVNLSSTSVAGPTNAQGVSGTNTITFATTTAPSSFNGDVISDGGEAFIPANTTITGVSSTGGITTVTMSANQTGNIANGQTITVKKAFGTGVRLNGYFTTAARSVTTQYGLEETLQNGEVLGAPTGGAEGVGTLNATSVYVNGVQAGPISKGTKFTTSGCSVSSTTGGPTAGIFTLGTNSCTVIVTLNGATGLTAPSGWTCQAHDRTAPTILIGGESSSSTTTASITIPAGAGATDVISFSCTGF